MTSLLSRVRKLRSNNDAVAATEFAIIVPFMLVLYVGGVELSDGMAINVKVSATSHAVADMVTQNTMLSTSQMQNILTGATAIIAPYPIGGGQLWVTVSEVSSDANGTLSLQWSKSYNGTSFGTGRSGLGSSAATATTPAYAALSLPTSLNGTTGNANNTNNQNDQVSFIVSEVSYAYTPSLGYTISGTVNLQDSDWLFPRCSTDSPANSTGPAYFDVKFGTTANPSNATCTCLQHLQSKTC